jgi:hypothetical protein
VDTIPIEQAPGSSCKGLSGKIGENGPQICKVSGLEYAKADRDVTASRRVTRAKTRDK